MSKFYVNDLNNPSAQRVLYFDILVFLTHHYSSDRVNVKTYPLNVVLFFLIKAYLQVISNQFVKNKKKVSTLYLFFNRSHKC